MTDTGLHSDSSVTRTVQLTPAATLPALSNQRKALIVKRGGNAERTLMQMIHVLMSVGLTASDAARAAIVLDEGGSVGDAQSAITHLPNPQ